MGGKAFAQHDPPLYTPRLPPQVYLALRDKYISILSTLFRYVACPIEAPSKPDHGDIDILVSEPYEEKLALLTGISHNNSTPAQRRDSEILAVKKLVNPRAAIKQHDTLNLAVPHPDLTDTFVQLDVHIFHSFKNWRWLLFAHAHGDFFELLGTSLRRVGLVATDKGFYARDSLIEPHNRKRCLIFLTDNPAEVIDFLDLDARYWHTPVMDERGESTLAPPICSFKDITHVFDAVAGMRFFDETAYVKSDLKPADRSRLEKRTIYRQFVQDYLPSITGCAFGEQTDSQNTSDSPDNKESEVDSAQQTQLRAERREQVVQLALSHWKQTETWRRNRSAWEWERLDLLSRRKFKEKKAFDREQLDR